MSNITKSIASRVYGALAKKLLDYAPIDGRQGWRRILDGYPGQWQQDVPIDYSTVDAYWADFSCKTLICGDIAKCPISVMTYNKITKIWEQTQKRPVLKAPNGYQTTMEFIFAWIMSELRTGNTYVLKQRNPTNGFIERLHILDPCLVTPLITTDGSVYYRLETHRLAGLVSAESVVVPASEIIHDRMYPLYHHLCGLPPVFACGVIAMQGSAIVNTSAGFFNNRGLPSGIMTAPGHIAEDTALRLKTYFDDNFTGANAGKVAVLGDGLKFESLGMKAAESQLIEQLKMTGEMIAACYHVPGYKIGVGPMPTVNNTAALNQQYYDQCLQYIMEKLEQRLDVGLELEVGVEQCWFDIGALMRMDPVTNSAVLGTRRKDGIISPNEARRELDMPPVVGGDMPFLQQQDYSLEDLARRSERDKSKGEEGNVQAQAMNGAQVGALQSLIESVSLGQMPPEAARAAISVAFPLLTDAEINAIIDPLKTFTAKPTTPAPAAPKEPDPAEPDPTEPAPEGPDEPAKKFTAEPTNEQLDEMFAANAELEVA